MIRTRLRSGGCTESRISKSPRSTASNNLRPPKLPDLCPPCAEQRPAHRQNRTPVANPQKCITERYVKANSTNPCLRPRSISSSSEIQHPEVCADHQRKPISQEISPKSQNAFISGEILERTMVNIENALNTTVKKMLSNRRLVFAGSNRTVIPVWLCRFAVTPMISWFCRRMSRVKKWLKKSS